MTGSKTDRRVRGWYGRCAARHLASPASLPYVDLLARRARAGDSSALEELSGHLGGIAEAMAAKYRHRLAPRGLERDDVRQEAMAAMLAALSTWRPDKASFRTHAFNAARFEILDLLSGYNAVRVNKEYADALMNGRAERLAKMAPRTRAALEAAMSGAYSLDGPSSRDDGESYAGWVRDAEDGYEEVLAELSIRTILRRGWGLLSPSEKEALTARFALGGAPERTMTELGRERGVTGQAAHNALERGLKKLRRVA